MFRVRKGSYGYLSRRKRQLWIHIGIVLAGIVILLALGIWTTGTRKNLLTIVAVVSVLPLANEAVVLIAVWKYHSRPKEEYDRVRSLVGNGLLNTELIVTSRTEKAMEIAYAYIHEKGVFCFCPDKNLDRRKAEEYLKGFLENNDLQYDVFVFRDLKRFLERLEELSPEDRNTCEEDLLRAEGVIRAIAV